MGLKQTILVTGVAGFIGSSLAKSLSYDYNIIGLDNYSAGTRDAVPDCVSRMYEGDICRERDIAQVFNYHKIDFVIHCAAQRDIRISKDEPILDATSNILGSLNLLEACVKHKVKKILYTNSGGASYGDTDVLPTPEDEPFVSACHYGVSKSTVERYLQVYNTLYNLPYISFRLSNVYGAGQTSSGEAGVVAVFTEKLFKGEQCSIFGKGKTRDYVEIFDLVSAFEKGLLSTQIGCFNIGNGVPVSDTEIFEKIVKAVQSCWPLTKKTRTPKYTNKRPGEVQHSCLDSTKARKVLKWKPTVSLEQGVATFVKWYYYSSIEIPKQKGIQS